MKLVSQSEFARLAGMSRQAVHDAIKRGAIEITIQGKKKYIDLDKKANKHYLIDKDNGQRKKKVPTKPQKKKVTNKQIKKQTEKKEIFTGKVLPIKDSIFEQGVLDLSDFTDEEIAKLSKHDLDRMKLKVVIEKERIKNEKERGQLIDRDLLTRVFQELYVIDRNEYLQLSAKLTSRICNTIFKTEDFQIAKRVNKTIDDELYKTLEHIRTTINKFLKKIKSEEVKKIDTA